MNRNLLSSFGSPTERVLRALDSLKMGNGILVVDDEDRENEGDLIFSTESLNTQQMALLISVNEQAKVTQSEHAKGTHFGRE